MKGLKQNMHVLQSVLTNAKWLQIFRKRCCKHNSDQPEFNENKNDNKLELHLRVLNVFLLHSANHFVYIYGSLFFQFFQVTLSIQEPSKGVYSFTRAFCFGGLHILSVCMKDYKRKILFRLRRKLLFAFCTLFALHCNILVLFQRANQMHTQNVFNCRFSY